MRKYKTIEEHVKVKKHEVIDLVVCDICGKESDDGHWREECYEHNDIKIEARIGSTYPEADCRDGYRYDICPDCFQNKLMPWFKEQGAEPTELDELY